MNESLDFIGPIEYHAVVLNGRRVPYLTATPVQGGQVTIELDGRFALDLSLADAQTIVPFMAHCLAVGMGHSAFPDAGEEPAPAVSMPRMQQLLDLS